MANHARVSNSGPARHDEPVNMPDTDRLGLRGGYGRDAAAFDRTRPVCPPQLFTGLVRLAGLTPGDRVLEIGCGTGQGTIPLAERGLAVTAVELDPALARLATARLARFGQVEVITSSFEDWTPDGSFDAVVAVNSLHWVDPAQRYAKPARLLRPGGALAVAECRWSTPDDADPFWADVQADYRAVGFAGAPPSPPEAIQPEPLPPEARAFFEDLAARRYPFTVTYSPEDYLANLASRAGTRQLGAGRSAEFLTRVRARLASLGWPPLTVTFVGLLTIGRSTP
jgi:SAM-dependent methyltransferase